MAGLVLHYAANRGTDRRQRMQAGPQPHALAFSRLRHPSRPRQDVIGR